MDAQSDGAPPPKRTKLFRACDSCVSSKTRCDDLQADGCALCRKKSRQCSLVQSTSASSPDLEQECRDTKARLEIVEARAWDLELRLRQVEGRAWVVPENTTGSNGLNTMSSTAMTSTLAYEPTYIQEPLPSPTADYDLSIMMDERRGAMWAFDERHSSMISRRGFPDVVQSGLFTKSQVDTTFQLWKHRWGPQVMLAPYLLVSTPTPTHPFIVIAILSHMTDANNPALQAALQESIAHVQTGAVSMEVIQALYILSINPCTPSMPSSVRLISMAYEIGLALGVDAVLKAGLDAGSLVCGALFTARYEDMLLWETVKYQYNWIHMTTARISTLTTSTISRFPEHTADHFRIAVRRLRSCAKMIDLFRDFIGIMAVMEAATIYSIPDTSAITLGWAVVQQQLKLFRQSDDFIGVERITLYTEYSIAYRAIKFFQSFPTPIAFSIRSQGWNYIGSDLCRISSLIVDDWVDETVNENIPVTAKRMSAIAGAIITILAVYAAVYKQYPNFLNLNIEKTKVAEEKVHAIGGMASNILRKMKAEFASDLDQPAAPTEAAESIDAGATDAGFDLLDPDLSAWSWLFTSQDNTADPFAQST